MHDKSTLKFYLKWDDTYDLVDAGHLRLEDGNCISNRWFLVSSSGSSESSGLEVYETLVS
jgi:hypothetical protein